MPEKKAGEKLKALLKVLDETNCGKCSYDEAEGLLIDHCDACCRKITTKVCSIVREEAT